MSGNLTHILINNPFDTTDLSRSIVTLEGGESVADVAVGFLDDDNYVVSLNGELIEAALAHEREVIDGDFVVICPIPRGGGGGKNVLRLVAIIAVAIVAPHIAAYMGFGAGAFTSGMALASGWAPLAVTGGIMAAGSMLVNHLIPIQNELPPTQSIDTSQSYGIDGAKNTQQEGVPVPIVYGKFRVGGNLINLYTRNVDDGDSQNVYMQFVMSEGPIQGIDHDSVLINDQPMSNFNEGETAHVEVRSNFGTANQTQMGWFDDTVTPQNIGAILTTDWTTRQTSGEVNRFRVDLVAPQGWRQLNDKGESVSIAQTLTIQYRKIGTTTWTDLASQGWVSGYVEKFRYTATATGADLDPDQIFDTLQWGARDGNVINITKSSRYGKDSVTTKIVQVGSVYDSPIYSEKPRISGKYTSAYRVSFQSDSMPVGEYEVRVKRDTAENTDDKWLDTLVWTDLNEMQNANVGYRHTALLGVRVRLDEQISGVPGVTAVVKGVRVKVLEYPEDSVSPTWTTEWSANPAWIALDMLTNARYGAAISLSRFDLTKWEEWADYCETEGLEFNGVFDTESNIWESLSYVLRCGRARIINIGTRFSVAIEKPTLPAMMFNVTNIVERSLSINWLPIADRANEIEISYFDELDDYKENTIKVVDTEAQSRFGRNVINLRLFGCVKESLAVKEAKLLLNLNRLLQQTVEFDAPIEAIACTIGDVIYVQHDVPVWGFGGRTEAGSTTTVINLDRPVNFEPAKTYSLLLHYDKILVNSGTVQAITAGRYVGVVGSVNGMIVNRIIVNGEDYGIVDTYSNSLGSGVITDRPVSASVGQAYQIWRTDAIVQKNVVHPGAGEHQQVTLTSAAPAAPAAQTKWMFGELNKEKKPFRVISISASSDEMTRHIRASEYYPEIYTRDTLATSAPNYSSLPLVTHVTNLSAVQIVTTVGTIYRPAISLEWSVSASYAGADIFVKRGNSQWAQVGSVRNRLRTWLYSDVSTSETLTFKVVSVDSSGTRGLFSSAPTVTISTIAGGPIIAAPTIVAANGSGKNVIISWENGTADNYLTSEVAYNTTNTTVGATTLGVVAGQQFTDLNLTQGARRYYFVRQRNTDGVVGPWSVGVTLAAPAAPTGLALTAPFIGTSFSMKWNANGSSLYEVKVYEGMTLRRTQRVTDALFVYTKADAVADAATGRSFTIRVYSVDVMDGVSAGFVEAIATNDPPALPTNLSVVAGFKVVQINFTVPSDPDYSHTAVWIGATTGFVRSAANLAGEVAGAPIIVGNLEDGLDYYVRLATYDAWGEGAVSAEYHVTTMDATDGLSPWAYVTDVDRAFIEANLQDDSIPSTKIESLTASRIVTGTLAATEKISVEGQIESVQGPYTVTMGGKTIGSKVALFSFLSGTTPIVAMYEDGSANFGSGVTINGMASSTLTASVSSTFRNGCEIDEIDAWDAMGGFTAVPTLSNVFSGTRAILARNSTSFTTNTDHLILRLPQEISMAFSGKKIRVSFYVRSAATDPSTQFTASYRVPGSVHSSGAFTFTPTSSYQLFYFEHTLGNLTTNAAHEIEIVPDASNTNKGILIDNVVVDLASTAGATWGTNLSGIPNRFADTPTTGLNLTASYLGYYNGTTWKTYMDNAGRFYLGSGANSLAWDGTTLAIQGRITIASGSTGYAGFSDKPTSLSGINSTEATKLSGVQAGATVGATWGANLSSIPNRFTDTPTTGLNLTATQLGYYNGSAWTSYMDNSGRFYLGSGANSLAWDGSTLTIQGNITVQDASVSTLKIAGNAVTATAASFFAGSVTAESATNTKAYANAISLVYNHGSTENVQVLVTCYARQADYRLNIGNGYYEGDCWVELLKSSIVITSGIAGSLFVDTSPIGFTSNFRDPGEYPLVQTYSMLLPPGNHTFLLRVVADNGRMTANSFGIVIMGVKR